MPGRTAVVPAVRNVRRARRRAPAPLSGRMPPTDMEPFLILVVVPVLIGVASELAFRDARRASLAATIGTALVICLSVQVLDSSAQWTWFAALLVSPLPIAFAVATALFLYGHLQTRRRNRRDGA